MANENLSKAKIAKNDEFYTQYADIQKEINAYLEYNPDVFRGKTILLPCDDPEWSNFTKFFAQNFENFGLKKLISTSYAVESKQIKQWQPTLFETENPNYDADKSRTNGKIFVLDHDTNQNGKIDIEDLEWQYLNGDGDFRSDEVKKLRNEADIIITNPPFSLFREFVAWIMEAKKHFLIIGNINCVTYKEIFPLLKQNKMWVGCRFNKRENGKNMTFSVPDFYPMKGTELYIDENGKKFISVAGTGWFTNLDHGRRHQPLSLMTMEDNIKFSKHKEVKGFGYQKYDNYDAIEVPFTDAIPSDYDGAMGVPISFLDKYCPEQFEILGAAQGSEEVAGDYYLGIISSIVYDGGKARPYINGKCVYNRILIRKKQ
ncbi:MAG: adenine-specific methyltransferase EcoRI family protein [Bacteroidales bacterium]|nr:adenine-specific methyltransferase EcoRI family protein [Bacteroidales bacterium]